MDTIQKIIVVFSDPWIIFGFFAQFIFFLRVLIQWILSEKHGRIVIPKLFWHLSIFGAALILIYAIHREDPVFIVSASLQIIIFSRSLYIQIKKGVEGRRRNYTGSIVVDRLNFLR